MRLLHGDAADAAEALAAERTAADLIYADPPFASGAVYRSVAAVRGTGDATASVERPAFEDPAGRGPDAYVRVWAPRLDAVWRGALRPGGSFYVHLDWRVAAHVRVHLDGTLGHDALRNEIVWRRNPPLGRKARAGQFGRVTDTILLYVRPGGPAVFHPQTTTRLAAPGSYRIDPATGRAFRTAPRGDYTDASIERLAREGRIHRTASGRTRIRYDLEPGGTGPDGRPAWLERFPVDCLWLDIPDAMHVPPAERTGYPTQKPERLLERVVAASSNAGDLVFDPVCGSGTTLAVAARLGRWAIGADRSPFAVHTAFARLARAGVAVRVERVGESAGGSTTEEGTLCAAIDSAGRVRLASYTPPRVPDWPGAAAAVELARATHGLALLEGWGIDRSGLDGPPALAAWFHRYGPELVPADAELPPGPPVDAVRVFAVDVFGHRACAVAARRGR